MVLVVCANNAVMFLIVWELMSIISYLLVMYEHEKKDTRKAGFIYIVMTHIGTGFIILSFLIFASSTGSFNFETFRGLAPLCPLTLKTWPSFLHLSVLEQRQELFLSIYGYHMPIRPPRAMYPHSCQE